MPVSVRPSDPETTALAGKLWADDDNPAAIEAGDLRIAELLGLDTAPWQASEALRRCGCGAYFWSGDGATVRRADGVYAHCCADCVCAEDTHVEVGERLQAAWDAQDRATDRWLTIHPLSSGGRA